MKTKVLFILIILFTTLFVNITYSDCNGWDGGMTRTVTVGDSCLIEYVFCYRINQNTRYHEIKIDEIRLLNCDCSKYELFKNQINDAILEDIVVNSGLIGIIWKIDSLSGRPMEIPECPDALCLICYDAICYNGCEDIGGGVLRLNKCDSFERKCFESTYFCWEWVGDERKLKIERERRAFIDPPCNLPCRVNCND